MNNMPDLEEETRATRMWSVTFRDRHSAVIDNDERQSFSDYERRPNHSPWHTFKDIDDALIVVRVADLVAFYEIKHRD